MLLSVIRLNSLTNKAYFILCIKGIMLKYFWTLSIILFYAKLDNG